MPAVWLMTKNYATCSLTPNLSLLRWSGVLDADGYETFEVVARTTSHDAALAAMRLLGVREYTDFTKHRASWDDPPVSLETKDV